MTTIIATKDRMIADSYVTASVAFNTQKIFKIKNSLFGYCGELGECLLMLEWIKDGCHKKHKPKIDESELIQINGKRIVVWDKHLIPILVSNPIYAIGSGSHYALGAVAAGASLEKAMEIASTLCTYTKPPFTSISI